MMTIEVDRYGRESGVIPVGVIRVEANVADAETVTVGSEVYEFDRAANGVTSGRIAVTGHADDTPANATNALITAINANDTNGLKAVDISDNEILLVAKGVSSGSISLAETMAGANNTIDTAVDGGKVGTQYAGSARVPTAAEVGHGNMHFAFPFTPTTVLVNVRVTATGAAKAWDGDVAITAASGDVPAYVTINNDGTTDWAATDTVHLAAFE